MSDTLPVVLHEIIIRQIMSEDNPHPMVEILSDDDDSLVERLGLLELAKDTIIRGAMAGPDDD